MPSSQARGTAPRTRASRIDHPRIGCSGWNYKSWKGRFYPEGLPPSRWLAYYASTFDTVEVNNTFYRLPEGPVFRSWKEETPEGFLMAVKASRFLTHMKRLRDPAEPLSRLFSRAGRLGPKLGPVLYQLPPNLHADLERLEAFLRVLASKRFASRQATHVFEFRHPSWYVEETYQLLERYHTVMCIHDKAGSAIEGPFVGPAVYVRFHGTSGRYHGSYPDKALRTWSARLVDQWNDGRAVYAYFNNDPEAVATKNALALRSFVDRGLHR
jgi:uncharacterized protein YecE (DUF72 family)